MSCVDFFYARTKVTGLDNIPPHGGVLIVANHPNGLVDPLVVALGVKRPVAFLGKSTLFHHPVSRLAMQAFQTIPVYRQKEADTAKNEESFAQCRERLSKGAWIALFPEGTSHSSTELLPLKTGAARIALSAAQESGPPFALLPVGLVYEAKDVFRSDVSVNIGAPFRIDDFAAQYAHDQRGAVDALTTEIANRLHDVVLEANDRELWQGFVFVSRWLGKWDARELSKAYRALAERSPETAQALVDEVRVFFQMLEEVGIDDPRALDVALSTPRALGMVNSLVVLAPFAALGALFGYVPYRVTGIVAERLAKTEHDLVSTLKMVGGLLFYSIAYLAEAGLAAWWLGAWAFPTLLLVAPMSGYLAVVFSERVRLRRQLLGRILGARAHLARIRERRQTLAEKIAGALGLQL